MKPGPPPTGVIPLGLQAALVARRHFAAPTTEVYRWLVDRMPVGLSDRAKGIWWAVCMCVLEIHGWRIPPSWWHAVQRKGWRA